VECVVSWLETFFDVAAPKGAFALRIDAPRRPGENVLYAHGLNLSG